MGGAIEPPESQAWVSPKNELVVGLSRQRWTQRRLMSEKTFGRFIALAGEVQELWINKGLCLAHLENGQYQAFDGDTGRILGPPFPPRVRSDAAYPLFSPDRMHVVLAHGEGANYSSRIWNVMNATEVGRFGLHYIAGRSVFSPDGKFFFCGGTENLLHVLDGRSGKEIGEPLRTRLSVWQVAVNSSGTLLAVHCKVLKPRKPNAKPGSEWDEMIQLWDVRTRALVAERQPELGGWETLDVSFSPDDQAVFVWRYQEQMDADGRNPMKTELWDCHSLGSLKLPDADVGEIRRIRISPDGRTAIATTAAKIVFLDPTNWRLLGEPRLAPGDLENVVFSPDGRTFIAEWTAQARDARIPSSAGT